jgi:hypothetical protein
MIMYGSKINTEQDTQSAVRSASNAFGNSNILY